MKTKITIQTLAFAGVMILASVLPAYGDGPVGQRTENAVQVPSALNDCEPEGGTAQIKTLPNPKRNPLIQKLHQARQANDRDEIQRLEALLPREPGTGESAGGTTLYPSTTFGAPGDFKLKNGGGLQKNGLFEASQTAFGNDVKIQFYNTSDMDWYHTLACASNGDMFVAWVDDSFDYNFIQIYKSVDEGQSWQAFGYIMCSSCDLEEPSLAIGEGAHGDMLLLTYILDRSLSVPTPEVVTSPLSAPDFTIHTLPVWGHWEDYAKPVIQTDAFGYSSWYAYVTCEGIFDSMSGNINVCSWRSTDGGETWGDETIVMGEFDTYAWLDPDITYGTTLNRVFIVSFNDDDLTLYTAASDTYGKSWNSLISFYTLPTIPYHAVDPEIAAATNHDNVMICCTRYGSGNDNIGQGYSTDAGQTWSTLWTLNGYRIYDEYAASLTANEGGGSWHLAFTSGQDHSVLYSRRPQDLSDYWQDKPDVVDDMRAAASGPETCIKGIASNWTTDVACIAWADGRDYDPGDLDGYVDLANTLGLVADKTAIHELVGGTVNFTLKAGSSNGGRGYILVGSISGTDPGTPLPGGMVTLPLNWDLFSDFVLSLINSSVFSNFMGTLNGSGRATAQLNAPPIPGFAYYTMYYAFALSNPWDHVSNAVGINIMP